VKSEGVVRPVSKRLLTALLLVVVLSSSSGCVYYNTFYHAQSAAREAEFLRETRAPDAPLGTAERDLLERAAEKSGRVLQIHPDSTWADDALLLLATTRYHQERYESAEQRLTEFLSLYADSELLPDAQYMLASVLLKRGNPVSAESYLMPLADAEPPHRLSDDALVLIGKARHDRKQYTQASESYEEVLSRLRGGDRRAEVRFLSAENYEAMGDLDLAAAQYALVPTERGSRTLAFEARMRLVEIDLARGRPDEALEVLEELSRRTDARDELDRVLLSKGSALEASGSLEEAVATYEGMAASHKRSDASAEAHYRIGLLQRDHYEQLDEAVASFKKAKDEAPRSEAAGLATEAARDIDKLRGFLAKIAAGTADDGSAADDAVEGAAGIPEEVDDPPEGVVDDTTHSVMLLPALGSGDGGEPWEELDAPSDSTDVAAAVIATAFAAPVESDTTGLAAVSPDTTIVDYVGPAPAAADSVIVPEPVDEVAVARFRTAELYLYRFDDPERARVHYSSVIENHPDGPLAPKAALALAWILETRLGDAHGARAAYESILVDYAGSEFAEAAAEGLARLDQADAD